MEHAYLRGGGFFRALPPLPRNQRHRDYAFRAFLWQIIMYQLGTGANHHIGYVYYDNGKRNQDALVIVDHPPDRGCRVRDLGAGHRRQARRRAVARRNGPSGKPILEYHKFCIIWHGLERPVVVDMDTLQRLAGPSEASSPPCTRPCDVGPEAELTMVYETGATARRRCTSPQSPTLTYEAVAVDTERPVTKDTAYGALVKAVNPRQLRVRKVMRMPPLPPQGSRPSTTTRSLCRKRGL